MFKLSLKLIGIAILIILAALSIAAYYFLFTASGAELIINKAAREYLKAEAFTYSKLTGDLLSGVFPNRITYPATACGLS